MSSSVRLSSVMCLSVTFVRHTQAIEIFGNVSTPFGTLAICELSVKVLRRSSQGNPSVGSQIAILDLSKAISRKRCKIGGKLLLITNRKSHNELSFRYFLQQKCRPNNPVFGDISLRRYWQGSPLARALK